jgi:hypothetical protein
MAEVSLQLSCKNRLFLELDKLFLLPTQQKNDVYIIMDLGVLASNAFTNKEIQQINYCWLYLQATTMWDICTADGVSLDHDMLLGTLGPSSSTSSWIQINLPSMP